MMNHFIFIALHFLSFHSLLAQQLSEKTIDDNHQTMITANI